MENIYEIERFAQVLKGLDLSELGMEEWQFLDEMRRIDELVNADQLHSWTYRDLVIDAYLHNFDDVTA